MTHPSGAAHLGRATVSNSAWYCGQLITFLAIGDDTAGRFALLRVRGRQGVDELLWHYHTAEDETIYVLQGELTVAYMGGETPQEERQEDLQELLELHAVSGDTVTIPRGLAHTIRYESSEVTYLVQFSPAGFERFFHEMSAPAEYLGLPPPSVPSDPDQALPERARIAATAAQYGCVVTQPIRPDQT